MMSISRWWKKGKMGWMFGVFWKSRSEQDSVGSLKF
jgi:hypothetical protein